MIYLLLILGGLFGGFLAGLFGVGGGIIYVIVLPVALNEFGVPQSELAHFTIANSLLATIFTAASALIRHKRNHNIFPKQSLILGLSGGLTAVLITVFVVETSFFTMNVFNWILIALLGYMLVDLAIGARKNQETLNLKETFAGYVPIGIVGGIVSAVSGLGGGIAVIPLVYKFQRNKFKEVASISMGFIAISALIVSLYNGWTETKSSGLTGSFGFLVFPITLALVSGVVVGAQFGVVANQKLSERNIKIGFTLLLLLLILWKVIEMNQNG